MSEDNEVMMYPYAYIYKTKRNVLVWVTSDNERDRFLVTSDFRLVSGDTIGALKLAVPELATNITWEEHFEIDLDKFFRSLQNLKPGTVSKTKTCEVLLNGWNFIEDLIRTLNPKMEADALRNPVLTQAYSKLFYGNNLPSLTPEGKCYHPEWEQEEIKQLRGAIRSIWKSIAVKLP